MVFIRVLLITNIIPLALVAYFRFSVKLMYFSVMLKIMYGFMELQKTTIAKNESPCSHSW